MATEDPTYAQVPRPTHGLLGTESFPDRSRFSFRQKWFDEWVRPQGEKHVVHLSSHRLRVLELGCFEGASSTWILDNLMSHPESTMTAVDTFGGGMEHQVQGQTDVYNLNTLEQRFRSNISKCTASDRLVVKKMTSDEALLDLRNEGAEFDFIYIDASHVAVDVLHDAIQCWRMLPVGGTMIFDDFSWKGYLEDCYNPRIAIQSFLKCVTPEVETMEAEGQMYVNRVSQKFQATPNPDPALFYWEEYPSIEANPASEVQKVVKAGRVQG